MYSRHSRCRCFLLYAPQLGCSPDSPPLFLSPFRLPPQALRQHGLLPALLRQAGELAAPELASSVWALAVLRVLRPATLRALAPQLHFLEPAFPPDSLLQLLQADLLLRGTSPGSLLPPAVAHRARALWQAGRPVEAALGDESPLLAEVLRSLEAGGVPCRAQHCSGVRELCVAAQVGAGRQAVLLPLAPAECTRSEPPRTLGEAAVRRRVLEAQDWEVAEVRSFEWALLRGDCERAAYLHRLLKYQPQATG